ncbi:MAG: hypothetical protein ABS46_00285 [Cytophagaceae bacterium SCN 52-12]|nr:MAG: hypothetical protein ABS46_00285 [Cytophagaceae bacterium SCN 52-12]
MLRATFQNVAWLLLLTFVSCTDHQVPAPVNPHIEIDTDWDGDEADINLKVIFHQLGNKPIRSYGLVMVKGGIDDDLTPTFNDTVIPFQSPPAAGLNVQVYPFQNLFPPNIVDDIGLFFKAYAELEDGTIVYGSSVHSMLYTFSGDPL